MTTEVNEIKLVRYGNVNKISYKWWEPVECLSNNNIATEPIICRSFI